MTARLGMLMVLFVFIAGITRSQATSDIRIQGKIGDYARQSRTYEIDGTIYTFAEAVIIEDTSGHRLDFRSLRQGVEVNLIGHMVYVHGKAEPIVHKIIVLTHLHN